jgi:DNA-binding transcriptional LysR family regulator
MLLDKNLNLLPVLISIGDHGSLSQAAKALKISQPALSHSLGRLRQDFHDPLFVRSQRGLLPTPKGNQLIANSREILRKIEALYATEDLNLKKVEGQFVIAATTYFELRVIGRLLARLKAEAPKVDLMTMPLRGEFPQRDLTEGKVNIAIAAYFSALPGSMQRQVLGRDPIVCLTRRDHPYTRAKNKLLRYLEYQHVVISVPPGEPQGIDLALASLGKSRAVACSLANFLTAPLLLKDTDYILTIPHSLAIAYGELYDLKVCKSPIEVPPIEIQMVWHSRFQSDPLHMWVRKLIREVFLAS